MSTAICDNSRRFYRFSPKALDEAKYQLTMFIMYYIITMYLILLLGGQNAKGIN